jgi:FAD/FMN-containing dehydrogenase
MKGIRIDPERRVARVQPGVVWGELDHETQRYNLATPGGEISETGVAGLTLGGGIGLTQRCFGLSCDNLLSLDIVTAEGAVVQATETENQDLFWALRGGGGNFGVVTSFEFQLHELGPEVFVMSVAYPWKNAASILEAWRAYANSAPKELTLRGRPRSWRTPVESHPPPV